MLRPELTILVDARNVLRSTWPNLSEEDVVEGSSVWAAAHGGRAVVVFDGAAPKGGVGTGAESADDWIAREAERLRAAGSRFWLVTSDRDLRARAGEGAERIIGGGTFARELGRLGE